MYSLKDNVEDIIRINHNRLEIKLDNKYTVEDIIQTLKQMNFHKKDGDYISTYNRTDITDLLLHERFNFRTDYEILSDKNIKNFSL